MNVYKCDYDDIELFVSAFKVGADAFFHNKADDAWYSAKVEFCDDLSEDDYRESFSDVDGEFITAKTAYYVGLEIGDKVNPKDLSLNVISSC